MEVADPFPDIPWIPMEKKYVMERLKNTLWSLLVVRPFVMDIIRSTCF
jgi:hypothetical protein